MLASLIRTWRRLKKAVFGSTHTDKQLAQSGFDSEWYLTAYPDVASSGMDPWQHYVKFGRFEGRLPRLNRALAWENALWRGAHAAMQNKLTWLLDDHDANLEEKFTARLALARWYRWKEQWHEVIAILTPEHTFNVENDARISPSSHAALLLIEACCRLECEEKDDSYRALLDQALSFLRDAFPETADTALASANARYDESGMLAPLNRFYARQGLMTLSLYTESGPLGLDNLSTQVQHDPAQAYQKLPLVSVIVPVYNAQAALDTALRGLCAQRGVRLEILAVDDASEDESVAVLERWQACCPSHVSLVVLRHESNQGAYAARNTGVAHASGAFITVHDSDDWSHPEKLCQQVTALKKDASVKASLSHWVRATPELLFHRWRLDEYGWVYPNISSLMIRREVLETLGFWDEVKVNADTEYRERIEAAYGAGSVVEVLPGVPLSFGRSSLNSLSQQSASHVVSQFGGMRYHYMEAARQWHRQAQAPSDLYLPRNPSARSFQAPVDMLRTLPEALNASSSDEERLRASSLFDPGWYLERYIDLQSVMIEPFEHFCTAGAREGLDPGPDFSTTGYARRFQQALSESGLAAWTHYLRAVEDDRATLDDALPIWEGERAHVGRPTVMLCAHQVGATLFGAERSLLDVLDALNTLAYNVVVLLPEAGNAAYEAMLLARCKALAVVPYGWWQQGKHPHPKTVAHIGRLLTRFAIDVVHVNTLVLDEPLAAAREANIPTVVHVRELPAFDRALCQTLGATPEQIVERTHAVSDVIIANSEAVAQAFQGKGTTPVRIVPNTIAMAPLLALMPPKMEEGETFRVGMLSSNLPKKGLDDIVRVARGLENDAPHIRLELFGPLSPALAYILRHSPPANLRYVGYIDSPAEVLIRVHAVVNLSHFQESFGRTVLEAMAAARPVVAYAWGALPELIVEGETGYLVPFGDTEAVAECLLRLSLSHDLCCRLGNAGRQRATEHYSAARLAQALRKSYDVLDAV